jgi:glycosyltransferase involved in cell wall biosynthesis
MDPVRVVFVSSGAKLGGEERYLSLLLGKLPPAWVAGIVCLEDGPYVERLRAEGRDVAVLQTSRHATGILASALRLRRRLRRLEPAVVHANGVKAALVSVLASRFGGPPVVWVKHDFSWDGRLARSVGARCRLVVGVSAVVCETFAGTQARTTVVHNGIPPGAPAREAGRARVLELLGAEEPAALIGLVARMDPTKGHRELIAALPRVLERVPQAILLFAGQEQAPYIGYPDELLREADADGNGPAVHYVGYRPDAAELIAGCDVLAVPTVTNPRGAGREGFSFVALEAMAAGTPIVGYAHGGLPEIVADCGVLVEPGDRSALAAELIRLLTSEEARAALATCGRARVSGEFSLDRTVAAMQDVYASSAKGGR